MRHAHSVDQVRAAEAELMATLPDGALMQRAAAGLATACADLLGRVYGARVLVLTGAGDNGGDALYAGARLARRGARVEALCVGEHVHGQGLSDLRAAGGRVVTAAGDADLVLDGIIGIGGRPGLRGRAAELVDRLDLPVVAVDVPSGIGVDTGELSGPHVAAELTVTFGTHKVGLFVDPAASSAVGAVELVDIGLQRYLGDPVIEVLQAGDVRRLLPRAQPVDHKYSRGVLGVVAGSPQYTGAGVLAVSAAVAAGFAGMVRYEGASEDLIRAAHPEVVIGPGQVQAWVVGSGIGRGLQGQVKSVLAERLPTVVDADGLRHLPSRAAAPMVLTPHAGELADMLDVARAEVEDRMLACAREAAERWDSVVLLKGARSVIAAPDGRFRVNPTGLPWLATAGAGDVLSGVIGSLLAAGLDGFDAASVGAWLHGA
ncbi:MAG: NAD(P)H-hydrate dehydratase, partial [Nocardioidaceae bacterium]|nr:NAD(P)H-hydrate dehydratase [Nocardioidaceae bacterium]